MANVNKLAGGPNHESTFQSSNLSGQRRRSKTKGDGVNIASPRASKTGPVVVALSGSPSAESKTAFLVDHILEVVAPHSAGISHIRLAELNGSALLKADLADVGVAAATAAVAQADGVIVATPIFKASFSGLLKSFLDGLPQFGLAGKAVLPIATGGSPAHVLALDYGLRPVLQSMGARHIVQSVFVGSAQLATDGGRCQLDEESESMLAEAILHFTHTLRLGAGGPVLLGHPRPGRKPADGNQSRANFN